jgi:hypothetical protein
VSGGWRGAFSPESPAAPTSGRDMKILFIFLAMTTSHTNLAEFTSATQRRSLGGLTQSVSCIVSGRLFNLRRWLACGAVSEIDMAVHFLQPSACSRELLVASSHPLFQDELEEKLSVTCQTSGARCNGGNKLKFSNATSFSVHSLYQTHVQSGICVCTRPIYVIGGERPNPDCSSWVNELAALSVW